MPELYQVCQATLPCQWETSMPCVCVVVNEVEAPAVGRAVDEGGVLWCDQPM